MKKQAKPATANLNRSEYEAVEALSFSLMKELLKSPGHYAAAKVAKREETKALRIGSATHMAALQHDRFLASYAMAPEVDRRTKEGKATWEAFAASLKPGQVALPFEEYNQVKSLADAFHTVAEQAGCYDCFDPDSWFECPLTAKDIKTPIKGIPDSVSPAGWIYDLKTTSDECTERAALRTILSYKYHLQAAHYRNLAHAHRDDILGFRIIMVEKDTLQGAVFEIRGELMDEGAKRCKEAYSVFDRCLASGEWPSLASEGIVTLDYLPGSKPAGMTV